jgi:60 kDa SS-A/Ro ribonucleoprotein
MTTKHLTREIARSVSPPQSEPLREDQVANSAGGYSWTVDKWAHLRRFLILGTEGGTYYISEKNLTKEGLDTVKACVAENGIQTVSDIVGVSQAGRAPKNDYALFALAACVAFGDETTKRVALENLDKVARIGTHLFQFANYLNEFGVLTGRAKRRAFANWYANKSAEKLAYDVIKYRQREGWSHRDILRLSHPGSISEVPETHGSIFGWVTGNELIGNVPEIVVGFDRIQLATSADEAANLIGEYGLPREAVPTEFLKSSVVWQALLDAGMPMTAMIRNLGNMTKIGLLTSQSEATKTVVNALKNDEAIAKARIHPLNVLFALKTYQSGGGFRGSGSWNAVTSIVNALDGAFYKAFGNVEPTGKRIMLALDISSSMGQTIGGTGLSCYEAEAAMALVTEAVEDNVEINGFNTTFEHLDITSRQRLDDVVRYISKRGFGGTDCAVPMLHATKKGLEIDAFVIYTDSETWRGGKHPAQALTEYRKRFVPDARLIVVGMTSNRFTIGDPFDAGTLNVVGFDAATPQIMSEFIAGRI